jgi:hypothetical protein
MRSSRKCQLWALRILLLCLPATFTSSACAQDRKAQKFFALNESMEERSFWRTIRTSSEREANSAFDKLVAIDPKKYIGERGRYYYAEHNNYQLALSDFNEAVRLQPDTWLPYRAKLFSDNGRLSESLSDYSQ